MGVRKTADFLEKTTWTLAIILLSLSLLSNFSKPEVETDEGSSIQEQIDNMPEPIQQVPQIPEQIPTPKQ